VNAPESEPEEDSVVEDPATDPAVSEISVAGSEEDDDPTDPVLDSLSGDEVTSDPASGVETETTEDSSVDDSVDPSTFSLTDSVDCGADVEPDV
jgi:hypothetical protein